MNNIEEYVILSNDAQKHRWGFLDTNFTITRDKMVYVTGNRYPISGYEMPYFIPFVEEVTEVAFSKQKRNEMLLALPKSKLTSATIKTLEKTFNYQFSMSEETRRIHSHGQTTADEYMRILYGGRLDSYADGVVFCKSKKDVVKIFELAKKYDFCVVPYGGGTSVSCALKLPKTEKRPFVVINVKGLSRILHIDKENLQVTVEAGITGLVLEQALQKKGLTLGHEPDSIEFSTVGGWIATNASGMKKNRYGNIEDIVENFTMVTPIGELTYTHAHSRVSMGMDMRKLLLGNEGNIGIITDVILKVFKKPEAQEYQSLIFKDFETGVSFLRELKDVKNLPASIRLVDNAQFRFGKALRSKAQGMLKKLSRWLESKVLQLKKFNEYKLTAATLVFEGTKKEVQSQKEIIKRLIKKHGGMFGGSNNGKRGYMLTYAIAYIRDFMSDYYIIGETYETTAPWNKIHDVCKAVEKIACKLHKEYNFPGKPYVSARITQIYQTGVCIYFTHGISHKGVTNAEKKFAEIEKKIRAAIIDVGGSISHHHGIGKIRAPFIANQFSPIVKKTLLSIKETLDPKNIMGIRNNIFFKK